MTPQPITAFELPVGSNGEWANNKATVHVVPDGTSRQYHLRLPFHSPLVLNDQEVATVVNLLLAAKGEATKEVSS